MDLVDIDQVLDNLEAELKADEQLSRNVAAAAAAAAAATAVNVGVETRPLGDGSAASTVAVSNGAVPSSGVATAGKSFVGVSQVFNSLNDYRNNVKSLATDIESHEGYDWSTEPDVATASAAAAAVPHSVSDADADLDDDAHEDLKKFSEEQQKSKTKLDDEITVSSTESLTTSSCSTFSSGPSPGNATNSELELEPEQESSTPEDVDKPSVWQAETTEETSKPQREPEQQQLPSVAVEDLAVGLSSISITNTNSTASQSILPCEVTASSALGKVLNELSAETSTKLDTQSQPQVAEKQPCDAEAAESTPKLAATELVNQLEPEQPQQLPAAPMRSQPLTFCSTMDEISDTELDSMLQEVDIEEETAEQQPTVAAVNAAVCQLSLQEVNDDEDEDEEEDVATESPVTEEESVRILSEQDTNSADPMNVDNFSQASTVEFAELRAQEATPAATTAAPELDSSYTSSSETDSWYDRKQTEYLEQAQQQDVEEQPEAEAETEAEAEDDSIATDALETQEQRPQRPQTLDLKPETEAAATDQPEPESQDTSAAEVEGEGAAGALPEDDDEDDSPIYEAVGYSDPHANLGKVPPIWVPDNMAGQCMQCQQKFTMIKRRHHCRACGKVLCSVCCSQRFHLQFANEPESRVCVQCFMILSERQANGGQSSSFEGAPPTALPPTPMRSPNPNNPMEYCSTIPPHHQVAAAAAGGAIVSPPSVIVPVGVLKKSDGSSSNSSGSDGKKGRKRKSVMFSDGIAPGSELASTMEQQWGEAKQARRGIQRSNSGAGQKPPTPVSSSTSSTNSNSSVDNSTTLGLVAQLFRGSIPPSAAAATLTAVTQAGQDQGAAGRNTAQSSPRRKVESQRNRKLPPCDAQGSFLPSEEHALPPICVAGNNCDVEYKEVRNNAELLERLQRETLKFMLKNNFHVLVKVVNMSCCMNRWVLNFTTSGLHHVGNDELIILLEIQAPQSPAASGAGAAAPPPLPRDIFQHLLDVYVEAEQARASTQELAFTSPRSANFLGSREHGGFIYIRPTYQCLQGVIVPDNPYLVAVLIHRHEVPWAKVLPLRLILRLGAQYRYYPCPLISVRNRESVYGEIAQTIINFLVDFRNYTYSLPAIRGLYIHMEDRQTTVIIPRHRQPEVIKAIDNSTDHILAFAGNFSKVADGHLVCMQNINDDRAEMYAYSTQAINIQGQPRKVTGASFFVLNEALKSSSGLSGKCSIVEDGLMVQIMPMKMEQVRQALRNQTDIDIVCGPIAATEEQSEIVSIKWVDDDRDINVGIKSPIDDKAMDGIANMRVHASFNYSNTNYAIRLTDIFILKCADWYATNGGNYADITRIAEQLARSASMALLPFLDLLAAAGINKLALRATLDQENVCYEAGARGSKLPPLYMNALDNHLIATLHGESSGIQNPIILELVFYILNA